MTRALALLLGLLLMVPAVAQQVPFPTAVEVQPSKMQLEMLKRGKSAADCASDQEVASCPSGTPAPCCMPRTMYDCGNGVYVTPGTACAPSNNQAIINLREGSKSSRDASDLAGPALPCPEEMAQCGGCDCPGVKK